MQKPWSGRSRWNQDRRTERVYGGKLNRNRAGNPGKTVQAAASKASGDPERKRWETEAWHTDGGRENDRTGDGADTEPHL